MKRALFLGVAAVVSLLVAVSPVRAAGVTRTAPFDFGVSCMEARVSFSVPPIGTGTPATCFATPAPSAYAGVLHAREDTTFSHAGVIQQGMTTGGLATSDSGPEWSATGLNVTLARAGKLTASAVIGEFDQGTVVCLSVGLPGRGPRDHFASSCRGASPAVSVDLASGSYVIQVTLYPGTKSQATLGSLCPPSGFATCTYGVGWASGQDRVTVKEISYLIG